MIPSLSKDQRSEALSLSKQLLGEISSPQKNKKGIAKTVETLKKILGMDNNQLADLLNVSVQTLYRWIKAESTPRKGHIDYLIETLSSEARRPISHEPREVIIGVSKFWDLTLLTGFELAFAAYNLKPVFRSLDSWHEDAHDAFVQGEIQLALHNHFTELYDQKHPRSIGLELVHPLFSYEGHHIFVGEECLSRLKGHHIAEALRSGRLKGLKPKADKEHLKVLRELLENARIGVERGTDLELAFRRAYHLAGMEFPSVDDNKINCGANGDPINGARENPYLATTEEAFAAFRNGTIDMYCGGWQQFYQLYQTHTPILLAPFELDVKSFNGLVAPKAFAQEEKDLLETIAQVWFCGIARFKEWGMRKLVGMDDLTRRQAVAELEAILAAAERSNGEADGLLPDNFVIPAHAMTELKRQFNADAPGKGYENSIDELVMASIREHRIYYEDKILEWATLLCEFDSFYPTKRDAKAAFDKWWMNDEVQTLWDDTKMDHLRGVHLINA